MTTFSRLPWTTSASTRLHEASGGGGREPRTAAGVKQRPRNAIWTAVSVDLDAFAGQTLRLVIEARDAGADGLIEAAIDDVRVYQRP